MTPPPDSSFAAGGILPPSGPSQTAYLRSFRRFKRGNAGSSREERAGSLLLPRGRSMTRFETSTELFRFAEKLMAQRLESLERDVAYCLKEKPYAPFPALLYCLATIDLLGALAGGQAHKSSPTTQQAADYMRLFMHYTDEHVRLLQTIFRHKLVHLASPKAVIEDSGRLIGWTYHHDNGQYHLKLSRLPQTRSVAIGSPSWTVDFDYEFEISIAHIVRDIRDSVYGPKGYLEALRTSADVQDCFSKAVEEIYNPAV